MQNVWIPILMLILLILSTIAVIVYREKTWANSRPTHYVSPLKVGVRYAAPAFLFPDLECLVEKIRDELDSFNRTQLWRDFNGNILDLSKDIEWFMSHLIIEIVPANGSRTTRFGTVSKASLIDGTIDIEQKYQWSDKYYVAVVLQREEMDSAAKSAIPHEIIKHLFPLCQWNDYNTSHSIKQLNDVCATVEKSCQTK